MPRVKFLEKFCPKTSARLEILKKFKNPSKKNTTATEMKKWKK